MSKAMVQDRVEKFQVLLEKNRIDAVMIRNIYSFTYFVGVQWWQPSLLIPQKGDPTIFVFGDEADELREKTWIGNILGYRKVEELMKAVVDSIRKTGAQTVGFDIDVDQSALLYEAFKAMQAGRKIVDVHGLIMQLRMVKDASEIERIRKASDCARVGLEAAVKSIRPGMTETAIAGEAQLAAKRKGAESVLIYVNAGQPRVHAHPRNKEVKKGDTVMVDIMPSYGGYFSDLAHTVFVGAATAEKKKAYKAFLMATDSYARSLKADAPLDELEKIAQNVYVQNGVDKYYVYGFAHGVGLRFEEDPITTIVVAERKQKTLENMVLNVGHAPLSGREIGSVKMEDTFLVKKDGAEKLTSYNREISEV
jgi:Xaa-Pro aminopeptidase